ncbi:MAG: methyltransferase domain-containing protein [Pseudomonadota bacterium]
MTDEKKSGLKAAYGLTSPEDNRRLYADWADSYDEDLRRDYDYVYPEAIAALFEERGGAGPILDIGCGTGLVGAALRTGPVDGIDLSPEMLAIAAEKNVYRALAEADLTATLPLATGAYSGLISAGVFTIGAVGADALTELVRVAAPGALFVLGINQKVFETGGFDARFAALADAGDITAPNFEARPIYGADAAHANAADMFTAAVFHRR